MKAAWALAVLVAACQTAPPTNGLRALKAQACACREATCAAEMDAALTRVLKGTAVQDLDTTSANLALDIALCNARAAQGAPADRPVADPNAPVREPTEEAPDPHAGHGH